VNPEAWTLNPKLSPSNPKPKTQNPPLCILNPKPNFVHTSTRFRVSPP